MELGLVGLGKMGVNIARRLARAGHHLVVYNRTTEKAVALAAEETNVTATSTVEELAARLSPPRAVWVMVLAGLVTEQAIGALQRVLSPGDTIIDGGNSNYHDTVRRAAQVEAAGMHLVDVGTSGGVWGLEEGFCLMAGGRQDIVDRLTPILSALAPAPDRGWGYVGPTGAGHFVKMVHNGIEYGLMESYAEGLEILKNRAEFQLDLHQVAEIWRYGSVIRSWLLDLAADALGKNPTLADIRGWVADSGEGRWTVAEAIDLNIPAPAITMALLMRLASRQDERFADKILAVLRDEFGGHGVHREGKEEAPPR